MPPRQLVVGSTNPAPCSILKLFGRDESGLSEDIHSPASTVAAESAETLSTPPSEVHMDLQERLSAVEAALRLQLAVGTSHLQEIEMAPRAFGLTAAARPAIRAIRQRRNAALHVVPKQAAANDTTKADGADDDTMKVVGADDDAMKAIDETALTHEAFDDPTKASSIVSAP